MKKLILTYICAFIVLIAFIAAQVSFFVSIWFISVDKQIAIVNNDEYKTILKLEITSDLEEYALFCDCPAELLINNINSDLIAAYQIAELNALYTLLRGYSYAPPHKIDLSDMYNAVYADTVEYCRQNGLPFDETTKQGINEIINGVQNIITQNVVLITAPNFETSPSLSSQLPKLQNAVSSIFILPWISAVIAVFFSVLLAFLLKHHKMRMLFWFSCIMVVSALIIGVLALVLFIDHPTARLAIDMPQVVFVADSLMNGFLLTLLFTEGVIFIVGGGLMVSYYQYRGIQSSRSRKRLSD
ncbi:MAG: hypothetical protein RRY79_06995 [Clostridia bacterium]